MAGLKEQAKWETEIYRIEENDPVWGGEDGTTNKPTKQLANRTQYLKQQVEKRASTTQVGQVQLTNDTGLDSETLALTAKAGKALAQQIAQNRLNTTNLANQKVDKTAISDSVTSTSQTTVASSRAVKTVYDLAMAKQSPATTLAGYGITDFKVQPASGNVNQFKTDGIYAFTSSSNTQNLPTNNAYHIQVIAGKDSNWCRQIAKKAYSIETYERWQTNYEQDQWSPWVRVDGVGWADIRNAPNASTARRGLAQYTDNVNFDSSDWGASAKALRTVNLKAEAAQTSANNAQNSANTAQTLANRAQTSANTAQTSANNANNNANNRVAKSGDTMTGHLHIKVANNDYSGVHLYNRANKKLVLEANPDSETTSIGNFVYRDGNDANTQAVLKLPKKNGTLATIEEVNNRVAKTGDTMTGTLTINTAEPRIHGNKNGQNGWFLGYPNNTNTEVFLHSYALNTELKLKSDRVETNKPIYVNNDRVALEKDYRVKEIAILTGVIDHGGTLPLPAGFTEAQCRWILSINEDNPTNRAWDIEENGAHVNYRFRCWANGRKVEAQTYQGGHGPLGSNWIPARANYMVIGVK